MRIPFFHRKEPEREYDRPEPTVLPDMKHGFLSALYLGARTGGDFYDVVMVPKTERIVFLLLDIAGKREHALHIAADVQKVFRSRVPLCFQDGVANEAEELTHLLLRVNRAIIDSVGGSHFCPAFVGSYNQQLGILFYANAGHTPGMLRDSGGVSLLNASGIPLGLFSHVTHDAQMQVLEPGAALVLVSRGLVECKQRAKEKEYGIERAQGLVENAQYADAHQICSAILEDAKKYVGANKSENDWTTFALVRSKAMQSAVSGT